MFNNFSWIVACRYFRAKKTEKIVSLISGFSLVGIGIGVAALIVVMSVMNGFHRELTKNIIGLNGDIVITSDSRYIANPSIIQSTLETLPIKGQISTIQGQALAIGKRTNSGVLIKGLSKKDLLYKKAISDHIIAGNMGNFDSNSIVIGNELAYNLGLKLGDSVKLLAPNMISTMFGSMPRSKEFIVSAIFHSGMYDYDSSVMLIPIKIASKFFAYPEDSINLIEIYSQNQNNNTDLIKKLSTLLPKNFRVSSWLDLNKQFLNALAIERVTMFTILSLIIVVAAFNIVSSLVMLVNDKNKDIAILKTIGASSWQIMIIFIINGMFVGIIGTIIGVVLGCGFAYNIDNIRIFLEQVSETKLFDSAIYFLSSLPSDMQLHDILLVVIISLLMCFLATIYPAYKASKLSPIEILRYV